MLGVHMMGGPPWKLARSWYRVPLPIKASMALTSLCLSAAPKDFTFRLTLLPPPQPDVFRPVLVSSTVVVEVVVVADSLTGFPMGIASVVGSSVVGTSLVASSGVVTSVVSTSSVVIPLVASVVAVLASSVVIPV